MSVKPDHVHLVCMFLPKVSVVSLMGTLKGGSESPTVTLAAGTMVLVD